MSKLPSIAIVLLMLFAASPSWSRDSANEAPGSAESARVDYFFPQERLVPIDQLQEMYMNGSVRERDVVSLRAGAGRCFLVDLLCNEETTSPCHGKGHALARECENFYRKRAARTKDPRLRKAFLGIAEIQRKHYLKLEHIITAEWKDVESLECTWRVTGFGNSKPRVHEGRRKEEPRPEPV